MWKNIIGASSLLLIFRPMLTVPGIRRNQYHGTWPLSMHVLVETRKLEPQVGTHADSLIAEAVVKGVTGFDVDLAWEAAYKDAMVPPKGDWNTS